MIKQTQQASELIDLTDYDRLDNMSDADIDYSDIPETDELFWAAAEIREPSPKKAISLRIDEVVATND